MEIKTWRDPYSSGFSPTKPTKIEIEEGLTVLVGCNGAGKTTLLQNIKDECSTAKIPCHLFDGLSESQSFGFLIGGYKDFDCDDTSLGISLWTASEGETIKINVTRQSSVYREFLSEGVFKDRYYHFSKMFSKSDDVIEDKRRFLLYDATDSGLSIDSICEIRFLFEQVLLEAQEMGVELYIIISANEYEMCRGAKCFDVNEGKYLTFPDYDSYRNFILKSRKKKEKRIEKQRVWFENQKKKKILELEKKKSGYEKMKQEFEEKAEKKGRKLTTGEKFRLMDMEREIKAFARENGLEEG